MKALGWIAVIVPLMAGCAPERPTLHGRYRVVLADTTLLIDGDIVRHSNGTIGVWWVDSAGNYSLMWGAPNASVKYVERVR